MIKYQETNAKKLRDELTDMDWSTCSVGEPIGKGLTLGFRGWGNPHVLLDPAIPLDAQVHSMGLEGAFSRVVSNGLLHLLHGDCTLTHGIKGLADLLMPGGCLEITYLSIPDIMGLALKALGAGDFAAAQVLEKACFKPPIDSTGVLFPQTMISRGKARELLFGEGLDIETVEGNPPDKLSSMFPDTFRLDGIENKVWEESAENFKMRDSLRQDRPACLLCGSVVTKRDHDRRYFSRYCKNHYSEARVLCDRALENAFLVRVVAKKKEDVQNAIKD